MECEGLKQLALVIDERSDRKTASNGTSRSKEEEEE
jgi:hypothetical protein